MKRRTVLSESALNGVAADKFDGDLHRLIRVAQQHAARGPLHSTQWAAAVRKLREARSSIRTMITTLPEKPT